MYLQAQELATNGSGIVNEPRVNPKPVAGKPKARWNEHITVRRVSNAVVVL